jgi:hypothetical protein
MTREKEWILFDREYDRNYLKLSSYVEGVYNYITMKITEDTATPTACKGPPESKGVKE